MAAMPRDVASRRPAPEPFGRFVARQRSLALRDGAVKVMVTERVQRHAVTRTVASWHDASPSSSKIRDKAGKRAPSRRTSKPAGASARRTPAAEPIDPPRQPSAKQRRSFRRSAAHHEQMRKLAREAQWQLRDDPMAGDLAAHVVALRHFPLDLAAAAIAVPVARALALNAGRTARGRGKGRMGGRGLPGVDVTLSVEDLDALREVLLVAARQSLEA